MLYIIATPIGNLQDITLRALETLKSCDLILCEDTRHSLRLLTHYGIHKPLKSYHEFNERKRCSEILLMLKEGKNVGLISDAGTPGISDPGALLVQLCHEKGIAVSGTPGPCAAILALSTAGLDIKRFQFMGFLPRKAGELKSSLQEALAYPGATVFYESPQRLLGTLDEIRQLAPDRLLTIARELTKAHEEIVRGTADELLGRWKEAAPKGEVVLIVSGGATDTTEQWEHLSPLEHVAMLEATYHLSRKEAIKLAAEMRGVSKNRIYSLFHKP